MQIVLMYIIKRHILISYNITDTKYDGGYQLL